MCVCWAICECSGSGFFSSAQFGVLVVVGFFSLFSCVLLFIHVFCFHCRYKIPVDSAQTYARRGNTHVNTFRRKKITRGQNCTQCVVFIAKKFYFLILCWIFISLYVFHLHIFNFQKLSICDLFRFSAICSLRFVSFSLFHFFSRFFFFLFFLNVKIFKHTQFSLFCLLLKCKRNFEVHDLYRWIE